MFEVQEAQLSSHKGPGTPANAWPPRLLENPGGVVCLYSSDEVMAEAIGCRLRCCTDGESTWLHWYIDSLLLKRPLTLRLIQGVPLQSILGERYTILWCISMLPYDSVPHLAQLELAELVKSPKPLQPLEFFQLASRAKELFPW